MASLKMTAEKREVLSSRNFSDIKHQKDLGCEYLVWTTKVGVVTEEVIPTEVIPGEFMIHQRVVGQEFPASVTLVKFFVPYVHPMVEKFSEKFGSPATLPEVSAFVRAVGRQKVYDLTQHLVYHNGRLRKVFRSQPNLACHGTKRVVSGHKLTPFLFVGHHSAGAEDVLSFHPTVGLCDPNQIVCFIKGA